MSGRIGAGLTCRWLRLQELAGRMLLVAVPRRGHDLARMEHGPAGLAFWPGQAVRAQLHPVSLWFSVVGTRSGRSC